MQTKTLEMVGVRFLSVSLLFVAGCATSQDVAGVRQDLQKELQDTRTKYDQSLSQAEAKRKASEELQARFAKDLKNQEQGLTTLTAKVQDLQGRQEDSSKERISAQGTHLALRDAILRALKVEQLDLQQRLKRLGDYIKEIEQADTMGIVRTPASTAESVKQDKAPTDAQMPMIREEQKSGK